MTIFRVTWKLDGHSVQSTLVSVEKLAVTLKETLTSSALTLKAHFEVPPIIEKVEVQ